MDFFLVTAHTTLSSLNFFFAVFDIFICPLCAGSNVPPSIPIFFYFLICPDPYTSFITYKLTKPTGPLGGNLFVDIPTSPPNPNSPPSANCVDELCIAIELLTFFIKYFAEKFIFRDYSIGMHSSVFIYMVNSFVNVID